MASGQPPPYTQAVSAAASGGINVGSPTGVGVPASVGPHQQRHSIQLPVQYAQGFFGGGGGGPKYVAYGATGPQTLVIISIFSNILKTWLYFYFRDRRRIPTVRLFISQNHRGRHRTVPMMAAAADQETVQLHHRKRKRSRPVRPIIRFTPKCKTLTLWVIFSFLVDFFDIVIFFRIHKNLSLWLLRTRITPLEIRTMSIRCRLPMRISSILPFRRSKCRKYLALFWGIFMGGLSSRHFRFRGCCS